MKQDQANMNIPELSVSEVIRQLLVMYSGAIRAGIPFRDLPTPFLWGPPGVGKSEGIRQLAKWLEEACGVHVEITDVRLLLYTPMELHGLPVLAEMQIVQDDPAKEKVVVWSKPAIFHMNPSKHVVNLVLLDELSAASLSVQAAAYQLTLEHRIGEHQLPDNCIVIAAGNRTTDQSVSYKMPKALANRLMHFCVRSDFASWKEWALNSGIDRRIIGYLSFYQAGLYQDPGASDLAYPTPRSWSKISTLLQAVGPDAPLETVHSSICGCVGTDAAVAFENWCHVYEHLPDTESILRGTCRDYPRTQDVLYALSASLLTAVHQRQTAISQTELENVCQYAARFPADFAMSFFRDLNSMKDGGLHLKLMKCPSMQAWLKKNKRYL